MKTRLVLSCLILLASLTDLCGQVAEGSKKSSEQREKWIKESVKTLEQFKPDSSVKIIEPYYVDMGDTKKLCFKVRTEGLIKLNSGDWIYIITHSSHDNEEIGDLCLAIDNSNNIYINESHVCGGMIRFDSTGITELKSTADFFNNFESDTDSKLWDKLVPLNHQPE